jgi:F0F1-type ATP synthase assembly protein I
MYYNHPINLIVRFLLEIAAIVVFVRWGWKHTGVAGYVLALLLPLTAMAIWGVFRVPGDPGNAPVAISGTIRLLIEAVFFSAAIIMLFKMESKSYGFAFFGIIILHYLVSYDRVARLLQS